MVKLKKYIYVLIVLSTALYTVSAAYASSIEDYTLSKYNDKVDRYHIASQVQIENCVKGGEGAQLVYTMAVSPQNTERMLLGNNTSGIYRSENGGAYWEPSSDGITAPCIDTVAFDPDDENIAYAAVATGSNSSRRVLLGKNLGLYKSVDGGKSWSHKLLLCNEQKVVSLIAFGRKDENGNRAMFTAASNAEDYEGDAKGTTGLWRSYDKGETWECIGFEDCSIAKIYTDDDIDLLIVASDKGIDVSYDNGDTFKSVKSNLTYLNTSAVAVDPTDKNHWTIGSRVELDSGLCGGMLYETYDGGESWSEVNGILYGRLPSTYIASLDYAYVNGRESTRLFMAVYKLNSPNRYSDDFGKNFSVSKFEVADTYGLYSEYEGYFTLPFCINPKNSNIIFTSMITPYKSTDGGETFKFSGSGYSGFMVNDFHFDENGAVDLMAVTDVGFVRMKPEDGTIFSSGIGISKITLPSYVSAKSSTALAVDPNNKNHGFAAMGGFIYGTPTTLLETNDGFKTLSPIDSFEALNSQNLKTVSQVQYHPQDNKTIYTDNYVSDDNGASWRETEHPISGISYADGDVIYSMDNYRIYISRDKGNSWTNTGLSTDVNGGKYSAFCVDGFYKDVVWTAEYGVVYRIDIANGKMDIYDGGTTKFVGATGNLLEFGSIIQNPRLKNHLLLTGRDINAGGSYVFETFDYGENWHVLDCIPYLAYESAIAFHPTENVVFFSGLMGTLVYKWDKSEWQLSKQLKFSEYNPLEETYTISGLTDSSYVFGPVTLAVTDESGNSKVYFTKTDKKGNFEFSINNIEQGSGEYTVRVGIADGENYFTDSFCTGSRKTDINAVYCLESQNLIIYGNCNYKVSFMLKQKEFEALDITDDNFLDAVKYLAEITPDNDGNFVYKFRFEIPEGKTIDDYNINLSADGLTYINVPITSIPDNECIFSITAGSKGLESTDTVDFTPGSDFKIDVRWIYFSKDRINAQIFAALFDDEGRMINIFGGDKVLNYDASSFDISGCMAEGCSELKVFLWSYMRPLGEYKSYVKNSR